MNDPQITIRARLEQTGFKEAKTEAEQLIHSTDEAQSSAERLVHSTDEAGSAAERLVNSTDKVKVSAEEAAKEFEKIDYATRAMADRRLLPNLSNTEIVELTKFRIELERIKALIADSESKGLPSVEEYEKSKNLLVGFDPYQKTYTYEERQAAIAARTTIAEFESNEQRKRKSEWLDSQIQAMEFRGRKPESEESQRPSSESDSEPKADSPKVAELMGTLVGGVIGGMLKPLLMGGGLGMIAHAFWGSTQQGLDTMNQFVRPMLALGGFGFSSSVLEDIAGQKDLLTQMGVSPIEKLQIGLQLARAVGPTGVNRLDEVAQFSLGGGLSVSEGAALAASLKSNYAGDVISLLPYISGTAQTGSFAGRTQLLAGNFQTLLSGYMNASGLPATDEKAMQLLGLYSGVASKGEIGVVGGAQYVNQIATSGVHASGRTDAFLLRAFMKHSKSANKDYLSFVDWKEDIGSQDYIDAVWSEASDEAGDLAGVALKELGIVSTVKQYKAFGKPQGGKVAAGGAAVGIPENFGKYNELIQDKSMRALRVGLSKAGYSKLAVDSFMASMGPMALMADMATPDYDTFFRSVYGENLDDYSYMNRDVVDVSNFGEFGEWVMEKMNTLPVAQREHFNKRFFTGKDAESNLKQLYEEHKKNVANSEYTKSMNDGIVRVKLDENTPTNPMYVTLVGSSGKMVDITPTIQSNLKDGAN